jgi:hypothetical protein
MPQEPVAEVNVEDENDSIGGQMKGILSKAST